MPSPNTTSPIKPLYVVELEKIFGPPSQNAFGSAVFFIPTTEQSDSLEADAVDKYRYFVGESWDRLGEQNWNGGWAKVYSRETGSPSGIHAELKSLKDRAARQSAGLLLENQEDTETSMRALESAFDQTPIEELFVFTMGDGAAMAGVMIAAKILDTGSLFLAVLMD